MKLFIFIFLFSVSVSAQNAPYKPSKNIFTTTVDGKSAYSGGLELTKEQVINATIGLKPDNTDQTIPKISALELFIPGYPVVNIKGDKLDEETKNKIKGVKKGDAIVIRGVVDNDNTDNPTRVLVSQVTLTD